MKPKNGNLNSPKNSPSYVLHLHLLIKSNLYLHSPWNTKFEDPGFKGTLLFNRINQHHIFHNKHFLWFSQCSGLSFHRTLHDDPDLVSEHTGSSAQFPILSACLAPDGHGALLCDREKMTLLLWRPPCRGVSHTQSGKLSTQMILLVLATRKKAERLYLAWHFITSLMASQGLAASQVRKKLHLVREKHWNKFPH